jgi:hypothetical protein
MLSTSNDMQIRRSILLLVAVVVALIALMLWHGRKQPVETPPAAAVVTNAAPPAASVPSAPVVSAPVPTNAPAVSVTATATNPPNPSPGGKIDQMRGILSTYNDVPIDFYGKLQDQFGNPVVGAEIKGNIRVINGVRQGTDWLTTTSDVNGLFQFHGRGQDIGMMPAKSGYALASTTTLFKYSRMEDHPYVSDANDPTVIKMWKLQGAEPLLSINQQYKLGYTPTPVCFDLLAGKIVPEGGDIKITVGRPAGVVSGSNPQDWSLKIEVVNGGLMDSSGQEAVTYAAPDSGYQASETFTMSTSSNTWYQAVHPGFFFTSRNGQVYGKLGVSFHINSEPDGLMTVSFGGVANTNGSRNLEGDPDTMNAAK